MDDLDYPIDPALSAQSKPTRTLTRTPATTTTTSSPSDDPVVASFNILVKPSLPAHRRVLVLEHPTRNDGKKPARAPLELRHKPATGMVEVDFPADHQNNYDRAKGLAWGTHLRKSVDAKKGGSHGLAGGFGVGAPPPRARRNGAGGGDNNEIMDMGMDWNEALRRDLVLRTQTLGGQTPDAGAESKYMVGVFAGSNLHLTPATSLIHLRPQLHHIDATTEQERIARGAPGTGPGGGKDGGSGAAAGPARAIHMTIKQTQDGSESIVQETMADRLKKVQAEAWRRHRYVHDESAQSWGVSEEALYLHGRGGGDEHAAAATAKTTADKTGEGEEEQEQEQEGGGGDGDDDKHGVAELVERVASLRTGWDEDGLLETTSGFRRVELGAVKVEISDDDGVAHAAKSGGGKGKGKAGENSAAGAATKLAGRSKTAAATTAATTNTTRGKKATTTATTTSSTTAPASAAKGKEVAKAGPSTRTRRGSKNE